MSVNAEIKTVSIPTYPLGEPERNPMFFEKRIYQGSNGSVYPLPFIDKVYNKTEDKRYQIASLENEYLYLEMLPEIGGRIFKGQDKTNSDYDFFYRQDVIKPALVGLAGPWISGGVEFNWPQHHRPGTYMPTDAYIERESDGAITVWMSELDPLSRMKGMHGIRIRPGSSLIELRVRLYNRTPNTQTFLWWANMAAQVHSEYQSFFPPDVHYVADHAVRALSSFPIATNDYYNIDYAARPGANDLSWYKNIPVPTSYMICETDGHFFGGYDFDKQGGFVHVANKHIVPGKKQWTWGNHEFGQAWDRELTDNGGPYIELMAGAYTDNQPDFSYLLPYETKSFSQYWWPIQKSGPVQEANKNAALRLVVREDRHIDASVLVSSVQKNSRIVLTRNGDCLLDERVDLSPGSPWIHTDLHFSGENEAILHLVLYDSDGRLLIEFRPIPSLPLRERNRTLAKEPLDPEAINSTEELFLVGEHLEQYRHPTRSPEPYWKEGLKRDSGNSRCHLALGKVALKRGEIESAQSHFSTSTSKQTSLHPTPSDGESFYYAGLCSRLMGNDSEAYAHFSKATWNYEWRSAAHFELGCLDLVHENLDTGLGNALRSQETNTDNNKAIILQAIVLSNLKRNSEARDLLDRLLKIDPLDPWAYYERVRLSGDTLESFRLQFRNDAQTMLDIAFDYARAGCFLLAIDALESHRSHTTISVATPNPLERSQSVLYALAWLHSKAENPERANAILEEANKQASDYFFPSRIEEQIALEWAQSQSSAWLIGYALGNYYYSKKRHEDAITAWERSVADKTPCATVYRNLGIAYWNKGQNEVAARQAYLTAIYLDPNDPRLIFEYDQLRKKLGDEPRSRLVYMEEHQTQVALRDDATVEQADLLNQCKRHEEALDLLLNRRFHPWEGGEGKVLKQYTVAKLALGQKLLERNEAPSALEQFQQAFKTPKNLGEAYHYLQAKADVNYWIGKALKAMGKKEEARLSFEKSASEQGDFQNMAVVAYTEISYYRGLSLIELEHINEAKDLFENILKYVEKEVNKTPKTDYFATSLPDLLVFDDCLQVSRRDHFKKLKDLAMHGLEKIESRQIRI